MQDEEIDADVCIVGAGPAGIALAEFLAENGKSVCLLESGGKEMGTHSFFSESLQIKGRSIREDSRIRAFGGTTKVWAGRWKLFDAIDFSERADIPFSGWPFSREVLLPFYNEAARRFGAPCTTEFTHPSVSEATQDFCADGVFEPTVFWTFPRKEVDFGARFFSRVAKNKNIQLVLDATLVHIQTSGAQVAHMRFRSRAGKEGTVCAKKYVLACGGIENARLLLISSIGGPAIGRYFMDHPKGVLATIRPSPKFMYANEWLRKDVSKGSYRVGFRLSEKLQSMKGILNSYIQLEPIYLESYWYKLLLKLGLSVPLQHVAVVSYLEQEPSGENRIVLVDEKDSFGLPKAELSWRLGQLDTKTIVELHSLLRQRLRQLDFGTLDTTTLETSPPGWERLRDASHHTGTTRMGNDPETSVINPDGRVHEIDNLYVVGSSVFPTSGHANPTATIIALALKLGHHLAHG